MCWLSQLTACFMAGVLSETQRFYGEPQPCGCCQNQRRSNKAGAQPNRSLRRRGRQSVACYSIVYTGPNSCGGDCNGQMFRKGIRDARDDPIDIPCSFGTNGAHSQMGPHARGGLIVESAVRACVQQLLVGTSSHGFPIFL
jgi:hypothetical protein